VLADEDDSMLRVISIPGASFIASAKLAGVPGHVVVDGSGTIWVAIRDADVVQSFTMSCTPGPEGCSLAPQKTIATAQEPLALAIARDGRSLFVVSSFGRELARYAIPSGEKKSATPIAGDARTILVARDGKSLMLAHAAGSTMTTAWVADEAAIATREARLDYRDHVFDESMTADRPVADEPRFASQGFAIARVGERVIAPMVVAYPGDPEPSPGYGPRGDAYFPQEMAVASFVDTADAGAPESPRLRVRATVVAADKNRVSHGRVAWPTDSTPCLLPRAAAPDASHGVVLVACMGIDQVIAVDASERPLMESIGTRFKVPAGPVAIAIDPAGKDAWVWSMFDRMISRIPLADVIGGGDAGAATTRVVSDPMLSGVPAREKLDAEWARGRALFHAPIAFDGRACASCHPDARNDGITWGSPKGPLQTPFLVGRLTDGAPFGWVGESATIESHLQKTLERLQAHALPDADMRAVARYAAGAKSFLSTRTRTPLEERGREIFESSESGCVLCHQDGGRKGDGGRHDVGTGGAYDTPSLRFIGASAPYMHDGRYTTLREVLAKTDGKMGTTKNLPEADLAALIAYLRWL
jgi:hypothetical protein